MPPRKRAREVIDLTDDTVAAPRAKSSRTAVSSSQAVPSPGPGHTLSQQQQNPLDDDEADLVGLTQADDGPALQLYGSLDNKIVGCRFYNGLVTPNEVVVLRREPTNAYVVAKPAFFQLWTPLTLLQL